MAGELHSRIMVLGLRRPGNKGIHTAACRHWIHLSCTETGMVMLLHGGTGTQQVHKIRPALPQYGTQYP